MPGKSLSFDYQIVEGEFTLKIHQEKSPAGPKQVDHIAVKDFKSILRYRLYGQILTSGKILMGKKTFKIKVP